MTSRNHLDTVRVERVLSESQEHVRPAISLFGQRRTGIFKFSSKSKAATVQRYIKALNTRDLKTATDLLAEHCRLVDSTGGYIEGRENAIAATEAFFAFESNFHMAVDDMVVRADEVLVRGQSSANEPGLANDTLWRAQVKDGKIVHWQSYGSGEHLRLADRLLPDQAHHGA